ncbi:UNVERIFIED_CONTAM: hypothetical protein RMT77_011371 [Armadillidium vulgare]
MHRFQLTALLTILCWSNASDFNIIELNHDLGPHSPFTPLPVNTTFKLTVQEAGYSRGFWLAYSEITTQQFISTFVAAPYSLYEFGITIDLIPFRDLFATAAVIDVRDKVAKNGLYEVTIEDVKNWIRKYGMFPKHCIVLFNTGWDEGRYPDQAAYFGSADGTITIFPGVKLETLKFILSYEETYGIHFAGFGIDSPGLDYGQTEVYPGEQMVAKLNKYFVGNMKELKRLPPKGAKIMVMPLKIKNGEAAPARVAAQLPWKL